MIVVDSTIEELKLLLRSLEAEYEYWVQAQVECLELDWMDLGSIDLEAVFVSKTVQGWSRGALGLS